MIELCLVFVARPELWESQFTSGISGVLPPLERLSLPGAAERVIWTGGDVTPDRIGVANWTSKLGAVVDVRPFWDSLEKQARDAMTIDERGELDRISGPDGSGDGSGGSRFEGSRVARGVPTRTPGPCGSGDGSKGDQGEGGASRKRGSPTRIPGPCGSGDGSKGDQGEGGTAPSLETIEGERATSFP